MAARFSHIGVLVRDLPASIDRFQTLFGAKVLETSYLAETQTEVTVLDLGGLHLELLSSTVPDSKVGRLLRERGEGVHHLSLEVDDIQGQMAQLQQAGVEFIDKVPRPGLHGRQIAFLSPQHTSGILIELAEENTHRQEKP